MANKITNCYIATRLNDGPLFSFIKHDVEINIDRYVICPIEYFDEKINKVRYKKKFKNRFKR